MERKKTPKLVIAFPTTTAAMAMESACGAALGRLIPTPAQISAGCGLAWCAQPYLERHLLHLMAENGIAFEEMRIVEFYG